MQKHLYRNRAVYRGTGGGRGLAAKSCPILCDHRDRLPGSSVQGDSPGKDTGVGCHALLEGIFPTQESNPGLLLCRQILYQLSYEVNGGAWWEGQDPQYERYLC